MQIAITYGKDAASTATLDCRDIFLEIVADPNGFVYTHREVNTSKKLGKRVARGGILSPWLYDPRTQGWL